MIKFLDILKEAKQAGMLYHFTLLKYLFPIIQDNMLKTSVTADHIGKKYKTIKHNPKCVSFTRTLNKEQFYISSDSDCVLVLDGDKLSNNYKISPHHDNSQLYFDDIEYDEMEERICKDITNLNKYLIKVILYKSTPEIESLLKEKNIPYEIK